MSVGVFSIFYFYSYDTTASHVIDYLLSLLAVIFVVGVLLFLFYRLYLSRLFEPLKCLVNFCLDSSEEKNNLPLCHSTTYEIEELKKAIINLHETNNKMCAQRKDLFKEAAHEIKSPLAVLKARIELFEKESVDKEQFIKESKEDIVHISNKLKELIFLKSIEWDMMQSRQRVTVLDQCAKMQQLFKPILEKRNLKVIQKQSDDFVLDVHLPAIQKIMYAIFENIFSNTAQGTTIFTYVDAQKMELKIHNTIASKEEDHLFSSGIGTQIITRLSQQLGFEYVTYIEDEQFITTITFR